MDQLTAIKVFSRVVELGSFTKAADTLGMPKTTVSKLVSDLESHLRIKLLKRSTRNVQVTPEGTEYLDRTARWLRELDDIDSAFDISRTLPKGKVQVDVSAWVASYVLIPRLLDFYARYPDIEIEMNVSDRTAHLIRETTDCAIRGGVFNDLSMVSRPIGTSKWVTVATPAYLDQFGTPQHPNELREGHLLINYQVAATGRAAPFHFQKDDEHLIISGKSMLSINESNAHVVAGLAGVGIMHTFEWKIGPYLENGRLVSILKDWQPAPYPFQLVYPPNRHLNNRVRVFMDWMIEVFAEMP